MTGKHSIGNTVLYYSQIGSTNDLAKQLLQTHSVPAGAVIVAQHQTNGRGQQNKKWESESGKNLLCSYIITEPLLNHINQITYNMALCLAIRDTIQSFCGKADVQIKWPNDIYANNKKIAGMLIENHLSGETWKYSIAGIGINVNQVYADHHPATSLHNLCDKTYELNEVLHTLSQAVNDRLNHTHASLAHDIHQVYNEHLLGKNQRITIVQNGTEMQGMLRAIDEQGRLVLEVDDGLRAFTYGDAKMIWRQ